LSVGWTDAIARRAQAATPLAVEGPMIAATSVTTSQDFAEMSLNSSALRVLAPVR
jgi:hypothetical protein